MLVSTELFRVDNSERKKAAFVYLKPQLWAKVCNTGAERACGIPVVHMLRRHPKPSKGGMGRYGVTQ